MSYYVKTIQGHIHAIEADSFEINVNYRGYQFFKKVDGAGPNPSVLVASFPVDNVVAVIEEDAHGGAWADEIGNQNPEPYSDEFFDAVWDIVDAWHEDDEPELDDVCADCRAAEVGPVELREVNGIREWGFAIADQWVGFGNDFDSKKWAEGGQQGAVEGYRDWTYDPLSETTPIPQNIGPVEYRKHGEFGDAYWGFSIGDQFVPFGGEENRDAAERNRQNELDGKHEDWSTWPLSETTLVEESK